jgi:hypothetical protein
MISSGTAGSKVDGTVEEATEKQGSTHRSDCSDSAHSRDSAETTDIVPAVDALEFRSDGTIVHHVFPLLALSVDGQLRSRMDCPLQPNSMRIVFICTKDVFANGSYRRESTLQTTINCPNCLGKLSLVSLDHLHNQAWANHAFVAAVVSILDTVY